MRSALIAMSFVALSWAIPADVVVAEEVRFQRVEFGADAPQTSVNALLQDSRGFVWLGLDGEIVRWDGLEAARFPLVDGEHRAEGDVTALVEMPRKTLMIATLGDGLWELEPHHGRLRRVASAEDHLPHPEVRDIHLDSDGRLWIATGGGLVLRDADGAYRSWDAAALARTGMDTADLIELEPAADGGLWIGTTSGLYRMASDSASATPASELVAGAEALDGSVVWAMLADGPELWVGTGVRGLFRLDLTQSTAERFRRGEGVGALHSDAVYSLIKDREGTLWVGTFDGLARMLPGEAGFRTSHRVEGFRSSLPGNTIYSLMEDHAGQIWIGTSLAGLARHDPATLAHDLIHADPSGGGLLASDVTAVAAAADGRLWLGSAHEGASRVDPESGRVDLRLTAATGLSADHVLAILPRGSEVLVGTVAGLDVAYADGEVRRLSGDGDFPEGIVIDLAPIDGGRVAAAVYGLGVVVMDAGGAVERVLLAGEDGPLPDARVAAVAAGTSGELWVGINGAGVVVVDPADGSVLERFMDPGSGGSATRILSVAVDPQGRAWVSTNGDGIYLLRRGAAPVRVPDPEGIADTLVSGVVVSSISAQGAQWIATRSSIIRLDQLSGELERYPVFGVGGNLIYPRAVAAGDRGQLYFGSRNGLISFHPGDLRRDETPPRLAVVELKSLDVSDGDGLRTGRWVDGRLILPAGTRDISLQVAALHFADPRSNRYRTRLTPSHEGWQESGAQRRDRVYRDLPPGSYRFEFTAANRDGVWNPEPYVLEFELPPSPWASDLAYMIYLGLGVLLFASGLWSVDRYQRRQRKVLRDVREKEQRLELALWGSANHPWDWALAEGGVFVSGILRQLGFPEDDASMSVSKLLTFVHPEDEMRLRDSARLLRFGEAEVMELEFRVSRSDGSWAWVAAQGRLVRDAAEMPSRVIGAVRDISEERDLRTQLELAGLAMETALDAVCVLDEDFRFIRVNQAFESVTGWTADEVLGEASSVLTSKAAPASDARAMRERLAEEGRWQGELWEVKRNGEEFLSWLRINQVEVQGGSSPLYVAVFTDITERVRTEEELRFLASFDPLTGLPNRALFNDRLERALARADDDRRPVSLLVLDLDRFKDVNGALGQSGGDRVLQVIAARLRDLMDTNDTVARLAADEFTIVLQDVGRGADLDRALERIRSALSGPIMVDDRSVRLSASIGVCVYPDLADDKESLLRNANAALAHVKVFARGGEQVFDPEQEGGGRDRLALEEALQQAIERDELAVHYQPKIDLQTGRVSGVEALLRWNSEILGNVPPDRFIPIAEDLGLIQAIGLWVIEQAVADMVELASEPASVGHVAINLSAAQAVAKGLPQQIQEVLQAHQLPASSIQLELTESLLVSGSGEALRVLETLRRMGIALVVDDFGTGYSSLSYLRRLPVDGIKVDRSFLQDVEEDAYARALVRAIVTMARSLDLSITAEGVETVEQLDFVTGIGCREAQGYHFARPMPLAELKAFLAERRS